MNTFDLPSPMNERKQKGIDPENGIKICVLGGGAVGKSSLTIQFLDKTFEDEYDPTVENSYNTKVTIKNNSFYVNILDTAGQDEYKPLMDTWIKNSDGFIFCYDITNPSSIEELKEIMEKVQRHKGDELIVPNLPFVPSVIVGCKCDLKGKSDRIIDIKSAFKITEDYLFTETTMSKNLKDVEFCLETSAKANINVKEAFESVILQYQMNQDYINKLKKTKPKKKGFFSSLSANKKEDVDDELKFK